MNGKFTSGMWPPKKSVLMSQLAVNSKRMKGVLVSVPLAAQVIYVTGPCGQNVLDALFTESHVDVFVLCSLSLCFL